MTEHYKIAVRSTQLREMGFITIKREMEEGTKLYMVHPKIMSEPFIHDVLLERYTKEQWDSLIEDSKKRIEAFRNKKGNVPGKYWKDKLAQKEVENEEEECGI